MKPKILTSDAYSLTTLNRSERDAIVQLQSLIPKLSQRDKTAFSLLLVYSYSISVGREMIVAPVSVLGQNLTAAILQLEILPPPIKLKLAIELLAQDIDEDGEDFPD